MKTRINKSFISIIVILAVLVGGLAFGPEKVSATYGSDNKTGLTYLLSKDKASWEVWQFDAPVNFSGKLIIPAIYKNLPVVKISSFSLDNEPKLTSVIIPNSVKEIGNYAFSGNTKLTSLSIPSSVVTLGNGVFADCVNLKSVSLKAGLKTMGSDVFNGCTHLNSIKLPDTLTKMGDRAFYDCQALKSIVIPGSLKTVPESAFSNNTSLSSVILGEGITTLSSGAFFYCSKIPSITLPGTLVTIGKDAFCGVAALTRIVIPSRVKTIGDYAFSGANLNTIIFNGKVSTIGDHAFWIPYASPNKLLTFNVPLGTTSYYSAKINKAQTNVDTGVIPSWATPYFAEQFNTDGLVAQSVTYNSIKLTWASAIGATGYEVSRSTSATGSFTTIANVTGTSYTNKSLKTGTKYYYRIRSYNGTSAKTYSLPSAVVMASPVPAVPATFKAARVSASSIKLTWKKVAGATGYEVRDSSGKLIKATSSLSYTKTGLKKGAKYSYKVRAYKTVSGKKVYGPYSTVKTATP